jgi:Chromate transporter
VIADLARLGWTFLWLSTICVGGGLGVVPEMQRQVVDRFHWVTAREFLDGYALSQLTPGPSMLVVVFVGYGAHGVIGGLVALAAMFLPASVLAALSARHWASLRHHPWAIAVERALLPVGIGSPRWRTRPWSARSSRPGACSTQRTRRGRPRLRPTCALPPPLIRNLSQSRGWTLPLQDAS